MWLKCALWERDSLLRRVSGVGEAGASVIE